MISRELIDGKSREDTYIWELLRKERGKKRVGELLMVKRAALLSPSSASTIFSCTVVDGRIATVVRIVKKGKGREKI